MPDDVATRRMDPHAGLLDAGWVGDENELIAFAVSPTMIGTIGVSPGSGENPASVIDARK